MLALLMFVQAVTAPTTPAAAPLPPPPYQVGIDTLATITSKLGKPLTVLHNSDGTTMALYSSTKTRVKGATFIPIVGMFAGGAKGSISSKTFTFDAAGLLKSYSSSDTNVDCSSAIVGANCK